jgi:hypothetical protein
VSRRRSSSATSDACNVRTQPSLLLSCRDSAIQNLLHVVLQGTAIPPMEGGGAEAADLCCCYVSILAALAYCAAAGHASARTAAALKRSPLQSIPDQGVFVRNAGPCRRRRL